MRYHNLPTWLCGLALLGLAVSQFLWIQNSRRILEEQFNNKADLALCMAVEDLVEDCREFKQECPDECLLAADLASGMSDQFDAAVGSALSFYDLPKDWTLTFYDDRERGREGTASCCSVLPMDETDVGVALTFPDRNRLIFAKMKVPILTSLAMIMLVGLGFVLALRRLHLARTTYRLNQTFYNNIGHELRTPLTNIGLATKLLRSNPDRQKKYLDVIDQETSRLHSHTERMLHLAALEDGSYQLSRERIDVHDLIEEVCDEIKLQTEQAGLALEVKLGRGIEIFADRYHFKNVISCLIDNAVKYGGPAPRLTIESFAKEEQIELKFSDNGKGISQQDQKHVFDKYYRADGKVRGYGLGLPYVKLIVEAHQGFVRLFSEVGKGSQFSLFIPAQIQPAL